MERLNISHFLTLTLLFTTLPLTTPQFHPLRNPEFLPDASGYLPDGSVEYQPGNTTRRVLEPFQLCVDCKCCMADDPNNCSSMPCCFGIDCDLPNKPYGFCSFVPHACNCTSCV